MLIETLGAARDMGRLNEIVGVLVRHGFGDTVRRLRLADRLERAGHALHWDHAADLARIQPPVQVRLAIEELGFARVVRPLFAEFMASRGESEHAACLVALTRIDKAHPSASPSAKDAA